MRKTIILFLALIMVLSVGCTSKSAAPSVKDQPAPQETSPTSPDTTAADYPPTLNEPTATTGNPGPDYPAPVGTSAMEAHANVRVELIEQADDPSNPAQVILKVKLLSSSPVEGSPDRFTPMMGQQIELLTNKEGLPALSPGDSFTADVVYRGDETNGSYSAQNLQK